MMGAEKLLSHVRQYPLVFFLHLFACSHASQSCFPHLPVTENKKKTIILFIHRSFAPSNKNYAKYLKYIFSYTLDTRASSGLWLLLCCNIIPE